MLYIWLSLHSIL